MFHYLTNNTIYSCSQLKKLLSFANFAIYITLLGTFVSGMGFLATYMFAWPQLPEVESLRQVQLQTPMRVYTRDGKLINEFGEKHRIPIRIDDVPEALNQALISTEDQRFYQHGGVDFLGLLRVSLKLLTSGRKQGGGSTITMQVARNFFLSFEQTFSRKIIEIFLSWKIEHALDKRTILELYWNKINFGHRAYGVGAAAQIYYGTTVDKLTLPQLAVIAGIPKGPSTHNPVSNPTKSFNRRNHVLYRMFAEKFIDRDTYNSSIKVPLTGFLHGPKAEVLAPYLAEMVRQKIIADFGKNSAYNDGLKIFTTLMAKDQQLARSSLRQGLIDYDKRHGYRGAEQQLNTEQMKSTEAIESILKDIPQFGGLQPAVILAVEEKSAQIYVKTVDDAKKVSFQLIDLPWSAIKWAKKYHPTGRWTPPPKKATDILAAGDQIRVYQNKNGSWNWGQIPEANSAFISVDAKDGAIRALEGGFDFDLSKFNRITQARRQPGSNIKPFIYSAALEKGFTAASIINDSPIVVVDKSSETIWRPKNDLDFLGPIRLRYALKRSINLVSIRILRSIGINYVIDYLTNFGFPAEHLPAVESLALGTAHLRAIELVGGYASFANGGFKITPYFIEHIEDTGGNYLYQALPDTACLECEQLIASEQLQLGPLQEKRETTTDEKSLIQSYPAYPVAPEQQAARIIGPRNNYIMNSLMRSVITSGTAAPRLRRTRSFIQKRLDVGGKTGTTNDNKDAWFSGYGGGIAASVWVGFDDSNRSLGSNEFGGRAALPVWQNYMESTLKNIPDNPLPQPPAITTVRIDSKTGKLATSDHKNSLFEIFRTELVPTEYSKDSTEVDPFAEKSRDSSDEKLIEKNKKDENKKDEDEIF